MTLARSVKWVAIGALVLIVMVRLVYIGLDRFGILERIRSAQMQVLVDDQAELMTAAQRDQIIDYHAAILDGFDIDFRVATLPADPAEAADLNMTAARRFAELEIGDLSSAGRGMLLLVAPHSDEVRIEVGRSLEPVFTDAFIAYIEERQMVPFFQAGRVADGILATTELIADRAGNGIRSAAFADPSGGAAEPSTGAGARTGAQIGAGYVRPGSSGGTGSAAGLGPMEVVAAYLGAMAAGNSNPELDIYTPTSREMMRNWVVTEAQMQNMTRTYRSCGPAQVFQESGRAVVRYDPDIRTCAPFFLRQSGGAWRLDLTQMSSAIRFNHKNQWHFAAGRPAEFAFAFEDWRFDKHGFPHR